MSVPAAVVVSFFAALVRIFGGAILLSILGAPSWAIAAWLMFHLRVSLDLSGLKKGQV